MRTEVSKLKLIYLLIFITLVGWAFFAYLTMVQLIQNNAIYAELINLSGKQRMLSQKTALIVKRIAEQQHDEKLQEHFNELVTTMKNEHNFIMNHLTSSNIKHIYLHQSNDLNSQVQHYFDLLDQFNQLPSQELMKKIESYSFTLLPILNKVVYEFEKESNLKTTELREREFYILLVTIFTLIIESIFIVLPTINKVIKHEIELEDKVNQQTQELIEKNKSLHESNKLILEKQQECATFFSCSIDGLAVIDLKSNFINANDAYANMLGYTKEELLSKSCFELTVLQEDKQKWITILEEILITKNIKNIEKKCVTKSNQIIVINVSASLLPDEQRILLVAKDVTNLKLIESNKKLASMGEMIGNIAHQWRQPLSAISVSAGALAIKYETNTLTDRDVEEFEKNILTKTKYLSDTIDTFRDFIKGGNEKEEVLVSQVIHEGINLVKDTFTNHHISIIDQVDCENDFKKKVFLSKHEFAQVIINILNNAKDIIIQKKIDNGWVKINHSFHNNSAVITIEDNGGGIPEDVLPHIFEPYFTTKHQSQGTGLGLHMSYKIITESMNGKIYATNTENGALFTIEIPFIETSN